MKKKILITGGTGFLGFNYLNFLRKKNIFSLYSLSRKFPKPRKKINNVKYLIGDLSNKNSLKKISKIKFDYVVNFAGNINHNEKIKTLNSHYKGVVNLVRILSRKNLIKFIQIGSSVEYGKIKSPQIEPKKIPNNKKVHSVYGQSKLLSTIFLMKENKKNDFPSVVVRPYLIYGPFQTPDRLIPYTIISCLKKKNFYCSSGVQVRDFLYVSDAIDFIYKIMRGKEVGKIYNIGSGKKVKVRKIIEYIVKFCRGGRPLFGRIKLRKDELLNLYPSINLAKSIRWKPSTDLLMGLKLTISHYKRKITYEK